VLEREPKIAARDPERIEALPEDLRAAIGQLMPFADQVPDDPEHSVPYQIQGKEIQTPTSSEKSYLNSTAKCNG
ncbi:MAG: hypothetical protein KGY49_08740, partial [Wenzhouxiangellaceae bacterium]|nr:hypothetical protein [Wenzhouxiangellaceae bacterium]